MVHFSSSSKCVSPDIAEVPGKKACARVPPADGKNRFISTFASLKQQCYPKIHAGLRKSHKLFQWNKMNRCILWRMFVAHAVIDNGVTRFVWWCYVYEFQHSWTQIARFTSSVERASVSVVVALEVDDDICVTAGNLPEPQRRDAAPLIEGVDEGPPMGENSSQCTSDNIVKQWMQQFLNLYWFLKLFCAGVKSLLAVLISMNK